MIAGQFGKETKAMRENKRQAGFSLIEMMVVVVIVGLLTAMAMPMLPWMLKTNREGAAHDLIRGFLTLARAHAAQTQKYAGIRFQQSYAGVQYIVLIEYADDPTNNNGFVAVANTKPIALPDGIATSIINNTGNVNDDCTFSIVFSPTGQLVTKMVEVCPESGHKTFGTYTATKRDPHDGFYRLLSHDSDQLTSAPWCGPEYSVGGLVIYEMGEEDPKWTPLLINMYTGTLIE
jgi:prepilin-type N-terminal cleavage/methylation domain-containing protein